MTSQRARRASDFFKWLVPAATLTLIPKCPACLTLYVALVTGVGISVSTVGYIRMVLIALALISLACMAGKQFRRYQTGTHAGAKGSLPHSCH